jgi:hypothetical protein
MNDDWVLSGGTCESCGNQTWIDNLIPPDKRKPVCIILRCHLGFYAERNRLLHLVNTPELIDFTKAVHLEAVHQRERWGSEHDEGKTSEDWFWVVGYLAGKALCSAKAGDISKLLHHLITTAAALNNWHAQVLGASNMRPGLSAEKTAVIDQQTSQGEISG